EALAYESELNEALRSAFKKEKRTSAGSAGSTAAFCHDCTSCASLFVPGRSVGLNAGIQGRVSNSHSESRESSSCQQQSSKVNKSHAYYRSISGLTTHSPTTLQTDNFSESIV
ncbi:neuropeptides capa receptor-like, partial [Tropilaelaps mercedesae]